MQHTRRAWLGSFLIAPALPGWANGDDAARLLRAGGGTVALFRHADAPGTFDPPGMRLDDCSTQRNLGDEGRAQARRMGEWFKAQGLQPAAVRSSPWCRCVDTARLGFGRAEVWAELGSPSGTSAAARSTQVAALRRALAQVRGFEVWVTHNFVIADLTAVSTASAEGLVVRADAGTVKVLATIAPA